MDARSVSASTRTIGRSTAAGRARALRAPPTVRCGDADTAQRDVHGFEVPAMSLVDLAVTAFVVAQSLQRGGTHGDADVQRGDGRGNPFAFGPLPHPLARSGRLRGQHPVEQDTVGDR